MHASALPKFLDEFGKATERTYKTFKNSTERVTKSFKQSMDKHLDIIRVFEKESEARTKETKASLNRLAENLRKPLINLADQIAKWKKTVSKLVDELEKE